MCNGVSSSFATAQLHSILHGSLHMCGITSPYPSIFAVGVLGFRLIAFPLPSRQQRLLAWHRLARRPGCFSSTSSCLERLVPRRFRTVQLQRRPYLSDETFSGTGEVGSRSHSWMTQRGEVRRLTVRRHQGYFNFQVCEVCRKWETVSVVFRSALCSSFLVVCLVFSLFPRQSGGTKTEHLAGGLLF